MPGGNLSSNINDLVTEIKSLHTDVTGKMVSSSDVNSLIQKVDKLNNYLSGGHISGGQLPQSNDGTSAQNVNTGDQSSNSPLTKIENYLNGILTQLSAFARAYTANKTEDLIKTLVDAEHQTRDKKNKTKAEERKIDTEYYRNILREKNPNKDEKNRALDRLREYEKEEKRLNRRLKYSGRRAAAFGVEKVAGVGTSIAKGVKADDIIGAATGVLSKLGPWGAAGGGIIQLLKAAFDLYAKQDKLASQYAREVGGGRTGKNEIFNRTTDWLNKNATWTNGYDNEELLTTAKEIAEANGRSINKLSDLSLKSGIDLKRMGIGADAVNNFDTFGKSVHETDKYFAKLYGEVSSKGLSFKNVSQAVNNNLKMAQSHTFASGLRGLEKMAERSVQLKYNMQQVASFADKVSTLEGALQASASLNVLGGSFAQLGNPMQMMFEGLNDMESLNERMIGMFGDLSYWDSSKQQMEMNAFDKQRVRAAATAMGIDPNEMISMSLNSGKMNRIEGQIRGGLDDKTIEYIKNLAELDENGKAKLTLNGQEKYVSELTNADREALKNESEAKTAKEGATLGDVWQGTMGIGDKLDNILKFLTTKLGVWVAKLAGVGFGGKENRAYWKNNKEDLKNKYGSRKEAKRALATGQEHESVLDYYGGEERINLLKSNKGSTYGYGSSIKAFADAVHNGVLDSLIKDKNVYLSDGQKTATSVSNIKSTNSNNQTSSYVASNSSKNSNNLAITKVQSKEPVYNQQPQNKNEKVNLNLNINGRLDLTSVDGSVSVDLSKVSESEALQFLQKNIKSIMNLIDKQNNMGYLKTSISNG